MIAESFWHGCVSGEYAVSLKTSLLRISVGYSLAVAFGILLGIAMGLLKWHDEGVSGILLGQIGRAHV